MKAKGLLMLGLGMAIALFSETANALPGQTTAEVAAWIKKNPTLSPYSGQTLLVHRTDTPAQRFTFEASVFAPGLATPSADPGIVRTERINLFDMINGVNFNRLQESLRSIYGLEIYQDFKQARVIYSYPNPAMVQQARTLTLPLQEALKGEIRLGSRFAYWVEFPQPQDGKPIMGKVTILLKSDVDKLEAQLRNR
ncbi:hypothetical protein ACE1B6_11990 [Aerosakkonemataceae cyanobacterium BLCC-F154]|uniref:Chalcone isomerase domain-containing protein n=1 Tax=Floridaenema fluviatile BLCC-F154 TaxID=3153640 RepID=A0ABV4YAZ5_9CYAN